LNSSIIQRSNWPADLFSREAPSAKSSLRRPRA
jgi:hypothetical protein